MASQEREYWNERAKLYGATAVGYGGTDSHDASTKFAFKHILNYDTLLDLGCGSGRLYETLKSHCKKYVGIDFSTEMLRLFRETCTLRSQDELHLADAGDRLPFPDESFDVVISNVVLQHIIDNKRFLKTISEIKRVLKVDGHLYLNESMAQGVPIKQPKKSQRIRPIKMYTRLFKPEISLESHGQVLPDQYFFFGTKTKIEIDESIVAVDVGSGRSKVLGCLGLDKRIVYRHGVRITDIMADAQHLPFKDRVIDELFCRNLIEHFENPYPILTEFHRVIKRKGKVTLVLPYAGTESAAGDPTHKFIMSPDTWSLILAGFFEKIDINPLGIRFQGVSERWKKWQVKLINLGFYEMAQGGTFICVRPKEYPVIRYIPWWLEDWVRAEYGSDLI